jgi:hypothetical protein
MAANAPQIQSAFIVRTNVVRDVLLLILPGLRSTLKMEELRSDIILPDDRASSPRR